MASVTFRRLLRELKLAQVNKASVKQSPMYNYLVDQFRDHQVTAKMHCKDENEMNYLAETYLCLLENTRKLNELRSAYAGEELSIEKSAKLVGLNLPKKTEH